MISYRKNRQGEWVVFGPASEVRVGVVTVTTKAGKKKTETVGSVGKSFNVGGVPHVYGYLRPKAAPSRSRRPQRGVDYCGYRCPVDGHRCTADNPCHDCI